VERAGGKRKSRGLEKKGTRWEGKGRGKEGRYRRKAVLDFAPFVKIPAGAHCLSFASGSVKIEGTSQRTTPTVASVVRIGAGKNFPI